MRIFLISLIYVFTPMNSFSHHDISQDIDLDNFVVIEGTHEAFEWANPHVIIHILVSSSNGPNQLWLIQADSPSALLRRGISRNSLLNLNGFVFKVYPSIANSCITTCVGYGLEFTDPAGRTLLLSYELQGLVNQLK